MDQIWKSPFGKLFVGGCGTQVGLVLSCGSLAAFFGFCLVCASTNFLAISLSQQSAQLFPTPITSTTPEPMPVSAFESLLGEIQLLHGEVEYLRSNVAVVAVPTATPTPTPTPFLSAMQSGINLRAGPGKQYSKVGVLPTAESIEIVGRNQDSTWWLVAIRNGQFAWVSADLVNATNINENIPVVTIPSLLVWGTPSSGGSTGGLPSPSSMPPAGPAAFEPAGTPTPGLEIQRTFVEEMPSYLRLRGQLLIPPVGASVSPDGKLIAMTERIKLYSVTTDGALSYIWLEDNADLGPLGNLVWSPDGEFLAFEVGYKQRYCQICRGVGLLRLTDGAIIYLEHPPGLDLSAPRWTLDGRLLVNAHPGEPASGAAYVFDRSGKGGQPASGTYLLSASHEGQRWYPWRPGKTWLAGSTERADSYNAD
jgi:hypothetical protein